MIKGRIVSIDLWKGITILSVLNIHTWFWSGYLYLPDWGRRISLLLDVPVFFFISGYLLQSTESRDVLRRGKRQFIRLLTDYAVTALSVLVIAVAGRNLFGGQPLPPSAWIDFASMFWLNPQGPLWAPWEVFGGSMWFLQVYVLVLVLGMIVLSSPMSRSLPYFSFVSFVVFVLTTLDYPLTPEFVISGFRFIAFCFSLFLSGAALKTDMVRLSIGHLRMAWICLFALTIGIYLQANTFPDLQTAKFPPSIVYLVFSLYSILAFCSLLLLESNGNFRATPSRLFLSLSWCGKNSFRIYLWQGVAASAPFLFIPSLLKLGTPAAAIYAIVLVWNVCMSLALTAFHNALESSLARGRRFKSPISDIDTADLID